MKKGILYILIVSYSTLMLKPVLPYVSDAFAHAFWYSQHMATVHYVNGKFHLHKEVMEETKKNTNDANPLSLKKEQSQQEHLVTEIKIPQPTLLIMKEYFSEYSLSLFPSHTEKNYPPPRV